MSDEKTMRHLWTDGVDTFSATTAEEATRMRNELFGHTDEDVKRWGIEPIDELVPDDKELPVTFHDGTGTGTMNPHYPDWVDDEPEARVEWVGDGDPKIARVVTLARVWATHESGMICSTEY